MLPSHPDLHCSEAGPCHLLRLRAPLLKDLFKNPIGFAIFFTIIFSLSKVFLLEMFKFGKIPYNAYTGRSSPAAGYFYCSFDRSLRSPDDGLYENE
jgi:hypothetical protein